MLGADGIRPPSPSRDAHKNEFVSFLPQGVGAGMAQPLAWQRVFVLVFHRRLRGTLCAGPPCPSFRLKAGGPLPLKHGGPDGGQGDCDRTFRKDGKLPFP